ncbi:hypothetical protein A3D70_00560 [Candidatus Adlerbacteria bacterium RIFCSPHIGHO2_02_FULL_54_18]|uniref:Uncharacterized protein n=2 Tax=Candidatus Adleribacteriota TaxID=1752736 RepID=A0A1F4Y1K2_9BACT|nr:MAG: hypothetical protein A2949_02820 [Candidatus Adlerbacteria bacterium RIFCSPLOWO2_01_FULL_54_21b]OGC87771.1 MAG: hypothetical protein A3D70_00560 [Candidatus Adlerbacteria bacterium RIFCSPHIGHO2_02_FULL_54_18]
MKGVIQIEVGEHGGLFFFTFAEVTIDLDLLRMDGDCFLRAEAISSRDYQEDDEEYCGNRHRETLRRQCVQFEGTILTKYVFVKLYTPSVTGITAEYFRVFSKRTRAMWHRVVWIRQFT